MRKQDWIQIVKGIVQRDYAQWDFAQGDYVQGDYIGDYVRGIMYGGQDYVWDEGLFPGRIMSGEICPGIMSEGRGDYVREGLISREDFGVGIMSRGLCLW